MKPEVSKKVSFLGIDIGYHQGLNFVVAMLLVTLRPVRKKGSGNVVESSGVDTSWNAAEEDAFWVTLSLLNGKRC